MTLCNLQSEVLLEGLLQNGRLTFDQLVWRTISKTPDGMSFIEVVIWPLFTRLLFYFLYFGLFQWHDFFFNFTPPINGSVHVSGSPKPTREEIRMNFNKLVYAHYVERCPKPEPFFDPLIDEQPTSTRKRAPRVSNFIPYWPLWVIGY